MFASEARRLREILLAQDDISPLLNLGSSTRAFRERTKPHIETELFAPLRAAGVEVVHCDRKAEDGVDVVGDVLDPALQSALAERGFRCVLLANLLEHVADRPTVAAACERIAGPGGLILATVPSSFPYHADPIDSGYRPSPGELAALFGGSRPILAEEVGGQSYGERLHTSGATVPGELARTLLSMLAAPLRPKRARARLDRWRWYGRPYRVSITLLRVG